VTAKPDIKMLETVPPHLWSPLFGKQARGYHYGLPLGHLFGQYELIGARCERFLLPISSRHIEESISIADRQTIGQLTGEFGDRQTIGHLTGEIIVDGQKFVNSLHFWREEGRWDINSRHRRQ
jgi:hypothetical protein